MLTKEQIKWHLTKSIANSIWKNGKSKGEKEDWRIAKNLIDEWWPANYCNSSKEYPQYQFENRKELVEKWEQLINSLYENWDAIGLFE